MLKEAMFYEALPDQKVQCLLCNHRCRIALSKYGICGVRQNMEGKLYTHIYGELIAANIDPIEKKPLFHFLPGTKSLSIATIGCNFHCPFCQNWQISQVSKKDEGELAYQEFSPENVVFQAKNHGCLSISYTYTEPTIFFEFAYDTAKLAKEDGLANVFVSNGYMTKEVIETISPFLDACNVDLKSFSDKFYKEMCGAELKYVLESIRLMKQLNIWLEITTLVIPGENDSLEDLTGIAGFIAELDPEIPWHISRFYPNYRLTEKHKTPLDTLQEAYTVGENAGLKYIYIGNVMGESEDTVCPQCRTPLICRYGYNIRDNKLKNAVCPSCGKHIPGIFKR